MNDKLSENNEFSTQENEDNSYSVDDKTNKLSHSTHLSVEKNSQHLLCTEQVACLPGHITNTKLHISIFNQKLSGFCALRKRWRQVSRFKGKRMVRFLEHI